MLKYSPLKRIGELCNGSTADSDSVCWGSNPYSPARTKHRKSGAFFRSGRGIEDSHHSSRSERGSYFASKSRRELAHERREQKSSPSANIPLQISFNKLTRDTAGAVCAFEPQANIPIPCDIITCFFFARSFLFINP